MRTKINNLRERMMLSLIEATRFANENKKSIFAMYAFAFLTTCIPTLAKAAGWEEKFPLWAATDAVLNVIYPIFVVVGIILLIVGVIMVFISRFNEQSITGPLIIVAVGIGLIIIRALLGGVVEKIAFNQMYPDAKNGGWTFVDGIPTQSGGR